MRIKHHLSDPTPEKPFEHDRLKREGHARALTKICDLYDDGFVLALNGEWGTGKSTFIKMWLASLQNSRPTAYFNAWSDDYSNDPLPALLATFQSLKATEDKPEAKKALWDEIVKLSGKLVKNGLPALLGLLLKKYTGVDGIDKFGEALTKGSIEYVTDEVKEFNERQESLQKLQELLTDYVKPAKGKKKAIVVIDELDRCRPHYAVTVLELVKHLFSVDGVVFVLAIDKEQLKHAICGMYGSEKLDASGYLMRFIDVEYVLPPANEEDLVKYFLGFYGFGPRDTNRHKVEMGESDAEVFEALLRVILRENTLSIRSLEKLLVKVRLALETIGRNEYKLPELLLFLGYLAHCHPDAIEMLSGTKIKPEYILENLKKYFPSKEGLEENVRFNLAYLEAGILIFYNNHFKGAAKLGITNYLNKEPAFALLQGLNSHYDDSQASFDKKLMYYFKEQKHRLYAKELRYFIEKLTQFSGLEIDEIE